MTKPRIPETNEGIQHAPDVNEYDLFLKSMRDRGWLETDQIIKSGIKEGIALEVGPGPGYLGLEWLKKTEGTKLKCIEISKNMIELARKNVREYGFRETRIEYIFGNAMDMPFSENSFDAVFSNGSLHEWEKTEIIFDEIHRVLKPGGKFFVSDLRRDVNLFLKGLLYISAKPKTIRKGLKTSLQASYTKKELERIIRSTSIRKADITTNPIGLVVKGKK